MELIDWKNIESGAERQIQDAEVQKIIGTILLKQAVIEIKKLGGKTNSEISAEVRK